MDLYSTPRGAGRHLTPATPAQFAGGNLSAAAQPALQKLRFPSDDGGRSLSEIAQRDLEAALKLLVDRAQYITGASGAAIALREGGHMICRARAGTSAPELDAELQMDFGLTGESVRTHQILRCDDAEADVRVNRESCRALGIVSVLVVPLKREQEVIGVFELLSGKPFAFEERDIVAVQRLAEMIQTALDQADAVKRAERELRPNVPSVEVAGGPTNPSAAAPHLPIAVKSPTPAAAAPNTPPGKSIERSDLSPIAAPMAHVHACQSCGFPVSEGRKLCIDCESMKQASSRDLPIAPSAAVPLFLSQYTTKAKSAGWVRSNIYWIGAVLVSLATAAMIILVRSR
jgi:GAF domain